jgi:hypothetical protein
MKLKIQIEEIYSQHSKAWNSVVNGDANELTWEEIDKRYEERYNAKLIRGQKLKGSMMLSGYKFIKFKNESAYVLFMFEWS